MPTTPQMPSEDIERQINAQSRQPFRNLLARFLQCAPSDEAIERLADRSPDRYAQALAIVSRQAGYNEHLVVEGSIEHRTADQSDAALLARLAQLQAQLDTQSNGHVPNPA